MQPAPNFGTAPKVYGQLSKFQVHTSIAQAGIKWLTWCSNRLVLSPLRMKLTAAQQNLMEQNAGRLLTVRQLSEVLQIPPTTIYHWVEALRLEPSFRACARGRMYFLLADVLTWLSRHRKVVDIADYRKAA